MAKSLVKKGLQLVKSGLTGNDEDPHSREKAGVSVKSRIPKVVQGSSSETGVHYHERRQKDRTFRLKKASIKKIVDYMHGSKATAHKRDLRVKKKKITGKRRKSKADKKAENQAKFSVMNIRD